jgi:E1A/CREB-binding protein
MCADIAARCCLQFDSLRRAKHSSMMVLYHLHNPEAPAFSSTCNFCHVEIEPGTGLRCTVCTDFDMCKNCKAAGMQHEHPMVVSGPHRLSVIVDVW